MPETRSPEAPPDVSDTVDHALPENASQIVEILEQHLRALNEGQAPSRDELLNRYPHLRRQLEACLAGLEFIHQQRTDIVPLTKLGDFRILREVGRGGMGAVYEAEQISLGRRVALKVLHFSGAPGSESIERFQREAATVAALHHTNIVPIFSVGSERGINYYAMQFILGQSLADVFSERGGKIEPRQLADWGLQAAEALAHAHRRGVIHRDVKPSNLLLDQDGRIWLTDFGLAKRSEDVTLSMTGALLGTPRYMSPEQASTTHRDIDHRTDLYSLGAALYELATGQPVFSAETPHHVIHQVLTEDPVSVRERRPDLPRDLETILMKCLAKDPAARYNSAAELADDLRAFLEDRPIRARRDHWLETGIKWLQRQRRSVVLAGQAVVATVLTGLLGITAWYAYTQSQLASLRLDTSQMPLVAEVLPADSDETIAWHSVPSATAIEHPAGSYRLRVSGEARFSETLLVDLAPQQETEVAFDLEGQVRWDGLKSLVTPIVWHHDDRSDLLVFDAAGLSLLDGRRGEALWTASVDAHGPVASDSSSSLEGRTQPMSSAISAAYPQDAPVFLTQGAVELNGDGRADIVLTGAREAWMIGLNGSSGDILWSVSPCRGPNEAAEADGKSTVSAANGPATLVGDCDGDGTADLAVVFVEQRNYDERASRRWIEVVSGATGKTIASHDISGEYFQLKPDESMPPAMRLFTGHAPGWSSSGGGVSYSYPAVVRSRRVTEWHGASLYRPDTLEWISPQHYQSGEAKAAGRLALVAGNRLVSLTLGPGSLQPSVAELPWRPSYPAEWSDVDGDKVPEAILLGETGQPASGGTPGDPLRLAVWSIRENRSLWSRPITAFAKRTSELGVPLPNWPVTIDLNQDGRLELLVPNGTSAAGSHWGQLPWGGLEAIDAVTGHSLWNFRLSTMDQQADHFTVGPDIDQDGYRDVMLAACWGEPCDLYVDAVSGRTGNSLWWARLPRQDRSRNPQPFRVDLLRWWSTDGEQRLLVSTRAAETTDRQQPCWYAFSAASGTYRGKLPRVDIVEELQAPGRSERDLLTVRSLPEVPGGEVQVSCLAGRPHELWRRPELRLAPAADFDADGVTDLLGHVQGAAVAVSGASGQQLWRTDISDLTGRELLDAAELQRGDVVTGRSPAESSRRSAGDLNGDGITDVYVCTGQGSSASSVPRSPVAALSGRDGRLLWEAPIHATTRAGTMLVDSRDLDADGAPEAVVVSATNMDFAPTPGFSTSTARLWLTVHSGAHGYILWKAALSKPYGGAGASPYPYEVARPGCTLPAAYGDFDGDGKLDLVLPAESQQDSRVWEIQARRGTDGTILWDSPMSEERRTASERPSSLAAVDLSGDGIADVVTLEFGSGSAGHWSAFVQAYHGRDGSRLWGWEHEVPIGTAEAASNSRDAQTWRDRPQISIVRGATGPRVVLNFWSPQSPQSLFVLDQQGRVVNHRSVELAGAFRARPCDIHGDAIDELLMLNEGSVAAFSSDQLDSPIWQTTTGEGRFVALEIEPSRRTDPPMIIAATEPRAASFCQIDSRSGAILSCVGTDLRRQGEGFAPFDVTPLGVDLKQKTRPVLVRHGPGAYCHDLVSSAPNQLDLSPPAVDPRLMRPLPWVEAGGPGVRDRLREFARSSMYSAFLIMVPGAWLLHWIRRRSWSLRGLLGLQAVLALGLLVLIMEDPTNRYRGFADKFMAGLAEVPTLVYLLLLASATIRKRWRLVGRWLAIAFGVTVVTALPHLFATNLRLDWGRGERFSWQGWYIPCLTGIYLTGLILTLGFPLRKLTEYFAAWRRRRTIVLTRGADV